MDVISLLGLAVGLASILLGQALEGGHIGSLFQPTALLIVMGGTAGAVMLQCTPAQFMLGLRRLPRVFLPPRHDLHQQLADLVSWSQIARKNGILSMEEFARAQEDNPFLQKGLQLLADGVDPVTLRHALELDINSLEQRERFAARVWESAGGYAPTLGILGAVLGLIHVMENLAEPSKLGGGIAVAFVATVYGVGLANLVFLPVAHKLKTLLTEQINLMEMQVEGLVAIGSGENPRILENRLQGFLDPSRPAPSVTEKPAVQSSTRHEPGDSA